jgi:hypothetical protein
MVSESAAALPPPSPEERACLLLARSSLQGSLIAELRLLIEQPLDWNRIVERALQQEVYPLLVRNLRDCGFPGVPGSVCEQLETLFRVNALRTSILSQELAGLLGVLDSAGIQAVPFKGPALSERLYGDAALRVCADLDILVPRQSVADAVRALQAGGYIADFSSWFLAPGRIKNIFEYPLHRTERSFDYHVELHWAVLWAGSSGEGAMAECWEQTRPTRFGNAPACALSPEWEFILLVAHVARHRWQGLKWLVDLDAFCARERVDWTKIRAIAERLGWLALVEKTFGVCRALLGTETPKSFARQIPRGIRWYPAEPSLPSSWENTLLCLSIARSPGEKLLTLLRRIFVPNLMDAEFTPMPAALGSLYYALRPLRLAVGIFRKPRRGIQESETSAAAVPATQEKR